MSMRRSRGNAMHMLCDLSSPAKSGKPTPCPEHDAGGVANIERESGYRVARFRGGRADASSPYQGRLMRKRLRRLAALPGLPHPQIGRLDAAAEAIGIEQRLRRAIVRELARAPPQASPDRSASRSASAS